MAATGNSCFNQKQELPVVAMFVKPVGGKLAIFIEDPP
jgi:hypothetical protein